MLFELGNSCEVRFLEVPNLSLPGNVDCCSDNYLLSLMRNGIGKCPFLKIIEK